MERRDQIQDSLGSVRLVPNLEFELLTVRSSMNGHQLRRNQFAVFSPDDIALTVIVRPNSRHAIVTYTGQQLIYNLLWEFRLVNWDLDSIELGNTGIQLFEEVRRRR